MSQFKYNYYLPDRKYLRKNNYIGKKKQYNLNYRTKYDRHN